MGHCHRRLPLAGLSLILVGLIVAEAIGMHVRRDVRNV
jgi:hypothetical protein